MEAQSHSYDRLVAEGDAEFEPTDQGEESAEEIEDKWREVLSCFEGTALRDGSPHSVTPDGSSRSVLFSRYSP